MIFYFPFFLIGNSERIAWMCLVDFHESVTQTICLFVFFVLPSLCHSRITLSQTAFNLKLEANIHSWQTEISKNLVRLGINEVRQNLWGHLIRQQGGVCFMFNFFFLNSEYLCARLWLEISKQTGLNGTLSDCEMAKHARTGWNNQGNTRQ